MPQEFYYPISSATHDLPYDGWTLAAGANKNVACRPGGGRSGPMTHDDATSYIVQTGAATQAFNPDWPALIATWTGVLTLGFRSNVSSGGPVTRSVKFSNSGGTTGTTVVTLSDSNVTFADHGPSDATSARPGGGAWTAADFVNDQTMFPVVVYGPETGTLNVTSMWGEISYIQSGGLVFLLQLAGLSALPFIGRMDFQQFQRYLSWRRKHHPRHTLLTGEETRQAWSELQAYRWPRYYFPKLA